MDKCTKAFSCQRKTRRWPMAVFMNLLDLCIHNAFLMFIAAHPDWHANSHRKKTFFLEWLAKALAIDYVRERQSVKTLHKSEQDAIEIFIKDYEQKYGAATNPTATCNKCSERKNLVLCEKCHTTCCERHNKAVKMYICSQCQLLQNTQMEYSTTRGRCYVCCEGGARAKDKKTSTSCHNCIKVVCKKHRSKILRTLCTTCSDSFKGKKDD